MDRLHLLAVSPYTHETVNQDGKEWSPRDAHEQPRMILESVQGRLLRYSRKHFDNYLREFTFRSNHRAQTSDV
jgi:hypothetical protein